mgnify:CR=1 FL=1
MLSFLARASYRLPPPFATVASARRRLAFASLGAAAVVAFLVAWGLGRPLAPRSWRGGRVGGGRCPGQSDVEWEIDALTVVGQLALPIRQLRRPAARRSRGGLA